MQTSPTTAKLDAAMAIAQANIRHAVKDSANPFFKSNYADLASVFTACREALAGAKVAVYQMAETVGDLVQVTTRLAHDGEWIESSLSVKPSKSDAQGIGSTITYLRRYSLSAMVGVAQDDDDGNAASGKEGQQQPVKLSPGRKTFKPAAAVGADPEPVTEIVALIDEFHKAMTRWDESWKDKDHDTVRKSLQARSASLKTKFDGAFIQRMTDEVNDRLEARQAEQAAA